jgi:hypothetical protein
MKNHNHDLVHQLSELLDSIWRFEEYKKNAAECADCQKLWDEMKAAYQEWEKRLVSEIERHIKRGVFE